MANKQRRESRRQAEVQRLTHLINVAAVKRQSLVEALSVEDVHIATLESELRKLEEKHEPAN